MPSPFPAIANLPTDEDGPNMAMEELPPPHNDLPLVTLINRVFHPSKVAAKAVTLSIRQQFGQKNWASENGGCMHTGGSISLQDHNICLWKATTLRTHHNISCCWLGILCWISWYDSTRGFKMYSLADASGHRTTLMALRNSMYLIPLGFLAYDYRSNIVTWKFAATDLECKAGIAHNGGLVPLLKLLDSKNGPLQHNAAFALYGLADNEDNASDFIRVGGIQRLQDGEFIVLATIDCVAKSLKRLEKNIHDRVRCNIQITSAFFCS
ncbi:hypothetical protein JHK86_004559 [Glycine max]|nr:hypothetical protein JHK86_004559 [Glycine max]